MIKDLFDRIACAFYVLFGARVLVIRTRPSKEKQGKDRITLWGTIDSSRIQVTVLRTLADSIEKDIQKVTREIQGTEAGDLIICPDCHGAGEKEKTVSYGGELEADVPVVCATCDGKGKISDDRVRFERYLELMDRLMTADKALSELWALKYHKDHFGKDKHYQKTQPQVWKQCEEAIIYIRQPYKSMS